MAQVVILEPDRRTVDKTPLLKWEYTSTQQAYRVHLIGEKTTNPATVIDVTKDDDIKELTLRKYPYYSGLDYGTYNAAVFVQNQYDAWENTPRRVASYECTSNCATIGFEGSATFGGIVGTPICIYNMGDEYDGVFWVHTVTDTMAAFYYAGGNVDLTLPPYAFFAKGAQLEFEIVPANERVYVFQDNRYTEDNASEMIEVATPEDGTGAYRLNNVVTFKTKGDHGLTRGNAVYVRGSTGGGGVGYNGLFNVSGTPSSTEFQVNQAGPDDFQGTGGFLTDFGFEDFPVLTSIDIDTNPERLQLGSLGVTEARYSTPGDYKLKKTTGVTNTKWGYIAYYPRVPLGSSLEVKVRVAADEAALEAATWSEHLPSGSSINLEGGALELWIHLTSSLERTTTAIIRDMVISYWIPGFVGGDKSIDINDFNTTDTRFLYYYNTRSIVNGTYGSGAVALTVDHEDHEYASPGYITMRHDSWGLNKWNAIRVYGAMPAETGATLAVSYKLYNKLKKSSSTAWSTPVSFPVGDLSPFCVTLGESGISNKRYMEVKIDFYTSDDKRGTPEVNKLELDWTQMVDPVSLYFYTTEVSLSSNLVSMILTANMQEPDGCEIHYGVSFNNSSNFDEFIPVDVNSLTNILNGGRFVKVGVEFWSGSLFEGLDDIPILHDLAYQLNTEDHDVEILNEGITT